MMAFRLVLVQGSSILQATSWFLDIFYNIDMPSVQHHPKAKPDKCLIPKSETTSLKVMSTSVRHRKMRTYQNHICAGYFYVNLTHTRVIKKEGTSVEIMFLYDLAVRHFLNQWLMKRAQTIV